VVPISRFGASYDQFLVGLVPHWMRNQHR